MLVSVHTAIVTVWIESLWFFPESYTAIDSWLGAQPMVDNGKTKGSELHHQGEFSVQLLYVRVSTKQQSRWCSQNLRRPFLLAMRFLSLHYITICGTISFIAEVLPVYVFFCIFTCLCFVFVCIFVLSLWFCNCFYPYYYQDEDIDTNHQCQQSPQIAYWHDPVLF